MLGKISSLIEYFLQLDNIVTVMSLIYTILSLIYKGKQKLLCWFREKGIRELLGFREVFIHIPSRSGENEINETRIKPVIAMEDYNTAEKMRNILVENHFNVKIKYIPYDGNIEFERNGANIVICGPKNSPKVKNVFDSFQGSLKFEKDENGWYFEDCDTASKLYSPIESRTEQYAFLGKLKIDGFKCLLICGIHAIGSDGVAFFLSDTNKIDELLKQVGKDDFYCIINSSYRCENRAVYDADLTNHIKIIENQGGSHE